MDEDISVKAPVTRLRRRMSMEGEDSPLPTTPSTPTKKRATRLAAKPQLELIDEVATENVPKKTTRKTTVKENLEADINTGTPTPLTPSRRSTRIRSNTSILSETTTQNIESPRAKRALRRNSQLGSDTESNVLTPARPTRKTRKDSTTNVDNKQAANKNVMVSSTNAEEKESKDSTKINQTDNVSPSTRKSPRLQNKKGSEIAVIDANKSVDNKSQVNDNNDVQINGIDIAISIESKKDKLSISNVNLIDEKKPKVYKNKKLNKSTSSIETIANELKNKRTKSLISLSSSIVGNEEIKTDKETKTTINSIGSGAGLPTSDENRNTSKLEVESNTLSSKKSVNTRKSIEKPLDSHQKLDYDNNKSDTAKLFEKSPSNIEPFVLIEDSDSCSGKLSMDIKIEGEDQCVPVVENPINESPKESELSVEPMDIDESMPVNVTIEDYSDKSNTSKDDIEVPKRKSSVSDKSTTKDESINKSKRKSSIRSEMSNGNENINIVNQSNKNTSLSSKINSSDQETNNKSVKEKSMVQGILDVDENDARTNKSLRKSSTSGENNEIINEISNKSKRKSSISSNNSINMNESTISQRNTSISVGSQFFVNDQNNSPNKSSNESKRKLSESLNNSTKKSLDKSQRKSSISIDKDNLEKLDQNLNSSKRKSSISFNNFAVNQSESKVALDSSQVITEDTEKSNETSNKSKRKSSISLNNSVINKKNTTNESIENLKKLNKNSSISQSNVLDENKSTLVISQLKDVSTNDTNPMSPNVTNSELSKSTNGVEVKKKGIEKKNLTNYLTSTPIQQKPLQKLTMQINTSIISPGIENKNNTSEKATKNPQKDIDSDFSEETDEEIKFKNSKESSILKNSIRSKKKYSRAPSSSESSDQEAETKRKSLIKNFTKKTPNKKSLEQSSSDSDSEGERDSENRKRAKNTPNKQQNQSISTSNKSNKTITPNKKPSESTDSSEESEQESSKDKSKLVDDEASDAGEDYESGDSQNEENRRFEAENEIVEKGETLDSEDEFSNDSDYEKDSFIVSSAAEDNDMLSGTGDDLSLSDNELNMSTKSKKKFNERKLKQQKSASKEMYEARHNIDVSTNSKKSKKSKRQRLESSNLESENDNSKLKKNNRQRIDSSQDSSMIKSYADESIRIKKKKSKRLSESVHDTTTNEQEITINKSATQVDDPLSVAIKQEPKTPQRNFDISTIAINEKIEVQVDENKSIMKQNDSLDPLQATTQDDDDDDSSSDNMEIIQNYDSVLNNLSMHTKKIKTADTSLNLNKKSKNFKNPVIDQLNLTQVKKSEKNKKAVEEKKTESIPLSRSSKAKDEEDSSDSIDMKLLFPEDSNDSEINASQFKMKTEDEPQENFIPLKRTEAQTNILLNMDNAEDSEDSNIKMFIDTTGTHQEEDLETSIMQTSSSKKKKHRRKMSMNESSVKQNDAEIEFIDTTSTHQEEDLETSIMQTSSSKKKKNKKKKSINESTVTQNDVEIDCIDGATETPEELSFTSKKQKKKNKNKSFEISINKIETSFAVTDIQSEKKKEKKLSTSLVETQIENTENTFIEDMPVNVSIRSEKNKKKDTSQVIEPEATNSSKKKNTSLSVEPETQNTEERPAETSMNSDKKKRKKKKNKQNPNNSQTNVDNAGDESDDAPMEMSYKSEKKSDTIDTVSEGAISSTEKKKHKKNKKKKNKNLAQSLEKSDGIEQDLCNESTKRKRKASTEAVTITTPNEIKKRKVHLDEECLAVYEDNKPNNEDSMKKPKKSKKNKNLDNVSQDELPKETKKRKNREDDNDEKIQKVSKQNSFDKIHVPKIPQSVVKQLLENPQSNRQSNVLKNKKKKSKSVIATMPFVVEEAERRKNKPSNYLEQSIYLNDSPVKTKQKVFKDKPKVLPFIPTALTSDSGYTSKFNINVLPGQTQFVAQASNVDNFRESYLGNQRIKKMGTLERFKLHRSHKISKF